MSAASLHSNVFFSRTTLESSISDVTLFQMSSFCCLEGTNGSPSVHSCNPELWLEMCLFVQKKGTGVQKCDTFSSLIFISNFITVYFILMLVAV